MLGDHWCAVRSRGLVGQRSIDGRRKTLNRVKFPLCCLMKPLRETPALYALNDGACEVAGFGFFLLGVQSVCQSVVLEAAELVVPATIPLDRVLVLKSLVSVTCN